MAAGGAGGTDGVDMSKRLLMVLVVAGGLLAGGEAAEEKSPKSLPKLVLRGCAGAGFAGAVGLVSKKEPPLSEDLVDGCLI